MKVVDSFQAPGPIWSWKDQNYNISVVEKFSWKSIFCCFCQNERERRSFGPKQMNAIIFSRSWTWTALTLYRNRRSRRMNSSTSIVWQSSIRVFLSTNNVREVFFASLFPVASLSSVALKIVKLLRNGAAVLLSLRVPLEVEHELGP